MTPSKTLLHIDDNSANYKQVSLEAWQYGYLQKIANNTNTISTKSIVMYELLCLVEDSTVDTIDKYEETLDSKLSGYNSVESYKTVESYNETVRKLKKRGVGYLENIDNPEKTMKDVKVWIPQEFEQSTDWDRGWKDRLETALVYSRRYWEDRASRINAKEEIIEYDNPEKADDDVAKKVIKIDELPSFESMIDFRENIDELDSWEKRYQAFSILYENCQPEKSNLIEMFERETDIDTTDYIKRKIDKWAKSNKCYEYQDIPPVTIDNFVELVDEYGDCNQTRKKIYQNLIQNIWENNISHIKLSVIHNLFLESKLSDSKETTKMKVIEWSDLVKTVSNEKIILRGNTDY
jgi:hypothetical protein